MAGGRAQSVQGLEVSDHIRLDLARETRHRLQPFLHQSGIDGAGRGLPGCPGVIGRSAHNKIGHADDFHGIDRCRLEIHQAQVAEFLAGLFEEIEQFPGDEHDVGLRIAARVDRCGIVGRAFAELHDEHVVGADAGGEFGFDRLEAVGLEVRVGVVVDESLHLGRRQRANQGLHFIGVGAGGSRFGEREDPVGLIHLEGEATSGAADLQAREADAAEVDECRVAPVVGRAGQTVENRDGQREHARLMQQLRVHLVAQWRPASEIDLPALAQELEGEGGRRHIQPVLGERPLAGDDFLLRDARLRNQILELRQDPFHGVLLGRVKDGDG